MKSKAIPVVVTGAGATFVDSCAGFQVVVLVNGKFSDFKKKVGERMINLISGHGISLFIIKFSDDFLQCISN